MSLSDLGALGEFLGFFAIIATLIYLSRQIRLAREDSAKAVLQARATAWREMVMQTVSVEALSETLIKAQDAYDEKPNRFERGLIEHGLSRVEANKVFRWMYAQWRMNQVWHQTHESEDRGDLDATLVGTYKVGLGRAFWEQFGGLGNTDFANHVNALLERD